MNKYKIIVYKFIVRKLKELDLYHEFHKCYGISQFSNMKLWELENVLWEMAKEYSELENSLKNLKPLMDILYVRLIHDFINSSSSLSHKFIENLSHSNFRHHKTNPSEYIKWLEKNYRIEDFISQSFAWDSTVDGYEYWGKIDDDYRNLEIFW